MALSHLKKNKQSQGLSPANLRVNTPESGRERAVDAEPRPGNAKEGVDMRFRTAIKVVLLSLSLFGGLSASAQYNAPATPAPYNPIALAEVTGAPRSAVQAEQSNYQTLSQNPYLGGVSSGQLTATPVQLSLEDAVTLGLKQNLGGVLASDAVIRCAGSRVGKRSATLLPNVITDYGFRGSSNECEGRLRSDYSRRTSDHWTIWLFRLTGISNTIRF